MEKKLAIKGHPTHGNEVIELLKMMGGRDVGVLKGNHDYYVIDECENNLIKFYGHDYIYCHEFVVLTLEEFLEKYPFKVGDKVIDDSGESGIIIEMKWDEEIIYKVDFGKECYYFASDFLRPYKETKSNAMKLADDTRERTHEDVIFDSIIWHLRNSVNNGKQNLSGGGCEDYFREVVKKNNENKMKNNENKMKNVLAELLEHIKTTSKEELEREFEEIEEWSNVGPTVEEFMTFCECVNKKPKYPTTYEKCCEKINACPIVIVSYDSDEDMLYNDEVDLTLLALRQLLICRNAYWKIAGEEMGLNVPWEPNWKSGEQKKYCIYYGSGIIQNGSWWNYNAILAFPTEEMRNAFYENFKDLIEQCKELL